MALRSIFLTIFLACLSIFSFGQTYNYVNGTLDITINGFNPCGTPAPNNGYLEITVNNADGGQALLIFLDGPGGNDTFNQFINQGSTFTFNASKTLPDGTYQIIIRDISGNFTINTFVDPSFPPIILTDITSPSLSEDVRTDNTSCFVPDGQVVSSISGGSTALAGGGSFNYTWTSDNGLAGLPITGTTDGSIPLDLAAELGQGLPGGTYTLFVEDNFSVCTASRSFTLTDPSPAVQNITTATPLTICNGDDITITLAASEAAPVTYEIIRNGTPTGITFPGAGGGAFPMTFSSATFVNNDIILVRATNGFCSPVIMNGTVTLLINPLPTVNAGADQTICEGSTVTLNGSIGGSASSATWSGGAGTFAPNNTTLNAVYTPTAGEIAAGTVTLTLTTDDPAGPCPAVNDAMTITINPAATVNAGADQTICEGSTVSLNGTIGGSATSATWSGGAGTFAPNNTTLNAVYTPTPAEVTAGTVTLTLTTNDPDGAGPCPAVNDAMTVTINPAATVNANVDQTICAGSTVTLNGSIGGSATSATWSGGAGIFTPNNTTLNAVYTPSAGEVAAGTVTLTLTTNDPDGAGPCPPAVDAMTVTINPIATVNAGVDQTICGGSTVTLNGTIGGSATSATWTGGAGTFAPNNTTLNAVYTPAPGEVAAGTVTLTLTTNDPDGAGPCAAVNDAMTITINPAATVNAGVDQTICAGNTVNLSGTIGGSASTATWSGGAGTFAPNNTTLNAVYTPTAGEIAAGTVTLTLTTNDPDGAGPCPAVNDAMTITINAASTANAGADQTICAGSTVTLNGTVGGSATGGTWSGGAGTFAPNNTTLNAVYTPSAGEVAAGTVTLTLTTSGPCAAAVDNMTITINPAATVNANADQTICAGSTVTLNGSIGGSATSATWSGGAGTFAPNNTTLNAVYTPTAGEIAAGTVTLTLTTNDPDGAGPCPAAADAMTITINAAATVNANVDQTICAGNTVTLNGSIGGSATSATWTGGAGTFAPNNTTLNAVYTPTAGEITAGTVTLTLTTNDPDGAGPCVAASDAMTITITAAATVNAGADQTICAGSTVTLNGTVGGSATGGTWSGGAGTFTPNNTTLNAVYTPTAGEITAGTVTLTLTTTGPCAPIADNMTITINPVATVNAGVDQTICAGGTVTLSGTIGGGATSATWSGGAGTFAPNNTTLNAVYTPTAGEVAAGTVTLTLTTNDPDGAGPCVAVNDAMTITINPAATVNAGSDQTICSGSNVTLNGTIGGAATSASWSGGAGTFTPDNLTLNATYTPTAGEIAAGTVTLTLTTNDPDGAGPCVAASDAVTITINGVGTADAGLDQTICAGSTVTLNGSVGGSATGGTWSGGAGTFAPGNTTLNAVYTPTAAEITAGTVTLTLTTIGPCLATDNVTITINPAATANANVDQTICAGGTVTLNGAIGGSATTATWSGGAGTFAPDNTTLNAVYTPSAGEVAAGTVTLTLTTNDPDGAGPCLAASDAMTVTITTAATVNAGADQVICEGSAVPLNGTIGGSATSATWSGGAGTFAPNNTTLNAVYTPTAAEITAGTVTLTLTTNDPDGAGSCVAASDNVTITINPAATVNANVDQTICGGSTVTLNGIIGGSAASATWSGGAGTFAPDNTTLNAVYTPSAGEVAAGTVTLTLTTNDPDGAGPCAAVADAMTVTITPGATVNAGADQTICESGTVSLNGTIGGAATSAAWSGGAGTFAPDNTTLNAVYTPTPAEITAGTVTLTLTTNDPDGAGICVAVSDNVTITINPAATVNANIDQTICAGNTVTLNGAIGGSATSATWSGGAGTFAPDNITLNAVYTPSAGEVTAGTVTLTLTTNDPDGAGPCVAVSDNMTITIAGPATVDAGVDQTICEGSNVTLNGTIGGSATGGTWSGGAGTFTPDNTTLSATYTPTAAEILAGTVTLTLTTSGPCAAVNDNVTITINPAATVNAGVDQIICSGGTVTLNGSIGGSATSATWSGGAGTFAPDNTTLNAVYTPTAGEVTAGSVTLTLTTNDPDGAGPCVGASDNVTITISSGATVNAGVDQTICAGNSATLAGSFTGAAGVTWTTSGDGTFNDATDPSAVYTPGANDIIAGTVTLTLTTGGPCAPVNDNVAITINAPATVNAGLDQTVCAGTTATLSGSFAGSATGVLWTSAGDGGFTDNTDPNAIYTPGAADITAGSVVLTLTATGTCAGVTDNMTLTINQAATVNAGIDQTICAGSAVTLNGTLGGSATTGTWTGGAGTFNPNNTTLNAVYTPSAGEITAGTVTLTLTTNNPAGPCPAVSDNVTITINAVPGDQVTFGNDTWLGYVYNDASSPAPPVSNIDFASAKYRGFIDATDIASLGASTYNVGTDVFNLNLGAATPLAGPNVCGSFTNDYSVKFRMRKNFAAGVYTFTVGGDDGVSLFIDGGADLLPGGSFDTHSYQTYTATVCLTAGNHDIEILYFERGGSSRVSFDYNTAVAPTVTTPVSVCVNSATAPTLTASNTDLSVTGFTWFSDAGLTTIVQTGPSGNFTPTLGSGATELDVTTVGSRSYFVTSIHGAGCEGPSAQIVINVVNSASIVITDATICESGGIVDLRNFVTEAPAGGAFVFAGHPNISGNNFDPTGVSGTVPITVDYSVGSCSAPQGTLNLTVTNSASTTVPAATIQTCEGSPDIDLTTLVTATPAGGTLVFGGSTGVVGTTFDPTGLSGIQTITVDYSVGGCVAAQETFDINVNANAILTINNGSVCEDGADVNLLTRVSATPAGGTFTFTGTGVTANSFDPSGLLGPINVTVDYDNNGCTASGTLVMTVIDPSDPACSSPTGNCATVIITPTPSPATCTNSDGSIFFNINPFTPTINNVGVIITIDGISTTNQTIARTQFNDPNFTALPIGVYSYTIVYGDPSCTKNGQVTIDQSGTVGTPVATNITGPNCAGTATGSLTLDVPGETGNVLEWSLDGGVSDPFKPFTAGSQLTGIPAGPAPSFERVISVRRNSSDPCYAAVRVIIQDSNPVITANFNITPATCSGNDGAITGIVASGGSGSGYEFSIDGGVNYKTQTSFTNLAGGSYTLSVRDGSGCERDFVANVTFPGFINSNITKADADCSNNANSGSITVAIPTAGSYQVAMSVDQFNPPPDEDYQNYNNPSVTFNSLSRGQYFIYTKSGSTECPTRSAPINIMGAFAIDFDIQPLCTGTDLSISLINIIGEPAVPIEIRVFKKFTNILVETIPVASIPPTASVFLDRAAHVFLQSPDEYQIQIVQVQSSFCLISSPLVDFTVPFELFAVVGDTKESYPDIPTGSLQVKGFVGGLNPYDVRIELDSASSVELPAFETDFEEVGLNNNQQFEKIYQQLPPGRYVVQVKDSLGCTLELIGRVPLDKDVFIPNIFTPNEDGVNDVFYIRNLPFGTEPKLIISNRWGKEVYSSNNYQNNWTGEGAADGIYFYRLQVQGADPITGWVEILRGQKP